VCPEVSGAVGDIADTSEDVRYAGDGGYTLSVIVTPGQAGDIGDNCAAGSQTSGSFTAVADTSVQFVGQMIITDPNPRHQFGGLQITPALGAGGTDIRCARDPVAAPDGSLTGSVVIDQGGDGAEESPSRIDADGLFRQTGMWACVARSVAGGKVPGPWSPPTATEVVQMGFYPKARGLRITDFRGPTYRVTERFIPPEAVGGILKVVIRRVRKRAPAIRVTTRIGPGGVATVGLRLPPLGEYAENAVYAATASFAGTKFAAPRAPFPAFALAELPEFHGRSELQFVPPCLPHRC
jgi:hypothetical protein